MTDTEDRLRQVLTAEAARTQADMLRALPAPTVSPAPRRPARRTGRLSGRRWRRWLAPAGAAVAVVAVIAAASLAGVGGRPARPAGGDPTAGMPRFYVTLAFHQPEALAEVHDARTGQLLSSIALPKAEQDAFPGSPGTIAAVTGDRTFAISAYENLGHRRSDIRVLLLRVSADGRTDHLTVTPLHLTRPGPQALVIGMAVSPDGSKLAATVRILTGTKLNAEIKVASLTGAFRTRTWTARQHAVALTPAWEADGRHLGFTWQVHRTTGPNSDALGVTQVRLLDTTAPGRNILVSKVLAEVAPNHGVIESGLLAADGRSILVTTSRNIAGRRPGHGTVILNVAQLSVPGGHVPRVFIRRAVPYSGPGQAVSADWDCSVWAVSTRGQHALVSCEDFGRLDGGTFTPLPKAPFSGVAW